MEAQSTRRDAETDKEEPAEEESGGDAKIDDQYSSGQPSTAVTIASKVPKNYVDVDSFRSTCLRYCEPSIKSSTNSNKRLAAGSGDDKQTNIIGAASKGLDPLGFSMHSDTSPEKKKTRNGNANVEHSEGSSSPLQRKLGHLFHENNQISRSDIGAIHNKHDNHLLKENNDEAGVVISRLRSTTKNAVMNYGLDHCTVHLPKPSEQQQATIDGVQELPTTPSPRQQQEPSRPGAFPQNGIDRQQSTNSTSMFTHYNDSAFLYDEPHLPDDDPLQEDYFNDDDDDSTRQHNNDGLVEANPVTETTAIEDLEVAQPIDRKAEESRQKTKQGERTRKNLLVWCLLPLPCVLLGLVGFIIYLVGRTTKQGEALVVQGQQSQNATTTASPTLEVTMMDPILPLLPSSTQFLILGDTDTSKPQTKAYEWIQGDPNLFNYSKERLVQRFAMACIYFATDGPEWTNQGGEPVIIALRGSGLAIATIPAGTHDTAGGGGTGPSPGGGGGRPPGSGGPPPGGGPPNGWGGGPGGVPGRPGGGPPSNGNGSGPPPSGPGGGPPPNGAGGGGPGPSGRPPPSRPGAGGHVGRPTGPEGPQGPPSIEFIIDKEEWLDYNFSECDYYTTYVAGTSICDSNNQTVQVFEMLQNELGGTLPGRDLALLSSLERLVVHTNSVGGEIPSELGQMTNMKLVDLSSNDLEGSLPSEIGLLSNTLRDFMASQNRLEGTLPKEIWKLSNLEKLKLDVNFLSGTIPDDINTLYPKLYNFNLAYNQFHGSLPPSLGNCRRLRQLGLNDNHLTGSIPTEIGLLNLISGLVLNGNQMTGTIPSELSLLPNLDRIHLSGNLAMHGSIPTDLGILNDGFRTLEIDGTAITGTIPNHLCTIPFLEFDCSSTLCGCDCPCTSE